MRKTIRKLTAIILTFTMFFTFNTIVFASEQNVQDVYQVEIDGQTYELSDGDTIVVPMVAVEPVTCGTNGSKTVVGNAGSLTVRASGHYVSWVIVMNKPATSFKGTISSVDLSSGFSSGMVNISGFTGSVYCARITGHTYSATITGSAYNGVLLVARAIGARVSWVV